MCESETRILGTALAASVTLFLFWDGPLWLAPPSTTHIGRIGLSYALVIPLLAALFARAKMLTTHRLITATAVVWAFKLIITSTLYMALVGGDRYAPTRAWESPSAAAPAPAPSTYAAAQAMTSPGRITGRVTAGGTPERGAIVSLAAPPPGLPPPAPREQTWVIRDGRHDEPVRLATTGDRVRVSSADTVLHTLRITSGGRALLNLPLIAGVPSREIAAPPPGEYELSCENHPRERAWLVVVDHPYAVRTDRAGTFEIKGVPTARHAVCVYAAGHGRVQRSVEVAPGSAQTVSVDVSADRGGIGGNR